MPRKKTRSSQISQKKYITKRLMAISLQVDKYIYRHKPISLSKAETYLQEVTDYKILCLRDARSLQVIEKLTRCMKSIIEESSEHRGLLIDSKNSFEPNESNIEYPTSPVYSLADEDRTYLNEYTQVQLINENVDDPIGTENNVAATVPGVSSHSPTKPMEVSYGIITNQNPAKINEYPITVANDILQNSIERGLRNEHETTSNLDSKPAKNIEPPVMSIDLSVTDDEQENTERMCSQSILNNVNTQYHFFSHNNYTNDACAQDMAEYDKEIDKIMQYKETLLVETDEGTCIKNSSQNKTNSKTITVIDMDAANSKTQDTTVILKNHEQRILNKVKNKRNRIKKDTNKNIIQNLEYNKIKKSKLRKSHPKNNENINKVTKKPCVIVSTNTNKGKPDNIMKKTTKKSRRNLEDDLSWVENIKYIRIMNVEEYDHKLNSLIDSFWENCNLPENWSDSEFE